MIRPPQGEQLRHGAEVQVSPPMQAAPGDTGCPASRSSGGKDQFVQLRKACKFDKMMIEACPLRPIKMLLPAYPLCGISIVSAKLGVARN